MTIPNTSRQSAARTIRNGLRLRHLGTGLVLAAIAMTVSSKAAADGAPTGLGCAAGYTLLIEDNVLTCSKPRTSGTALKTASLSACNRPLTLVVKSGADQCKSGSTVATPTCPPDYVLKKDYSGTSDRCVFYGYDYQPPEEI